jgi:hypothetical protein
MTDQQLLLMIYKQLLDWAYQSEHGGWSTHQVHPQKELASKIANHIILSQVGKNNVTPNID